MKIEMLVTDDHVIIRNNLMCLLADTEDLVVAGEASNGEEALAETDWRLDMKKRFSEEQIIGFLREAEAGQLLRPGNRQGVRDDYAADLSGAIER